ncbi:hypothetical protein TCAL_05353 [Tigriopus californicus]|uniref:G-protein coupled receptors family 1 profile domain-containing protein n=1 Tax=Tigriopus californicus TaxID=6832 RepID=A0A553NPV8_TIGCA|nr:hypothetical protein TCAL_05353 [Tigriopus californicus]
MPQAHNVNSGVSEVSVAPTSAAHSNRILLSVVAMLILFFLSALGNVTVFSTLVTSRSRKTRISIIILHLTIADLFVTFIIIPAEIGWRLFGYWLAGNVACKIFSFSRAFGFYLSSMVLIVVSLDRYIAIIYPLRANSEFAKRGHIMLMAAWAISALCSLPQAFIWNTEPAPNTPNMEQCVTFGSDTMVVTGFTLFFLTTVYFIPLIIMVFTYSRILSTIIKQSSDFRQNPPGDPNPAMSTTATTDMMVNHGNGNTQAILVTAPPSLHPRCGSPLGLYGASCQQASRASITNDGRLARILTNESRSRRRSFYASTDPCQPTRSNQSGRNDSTRTGGHAVSTRCLGSGENFRSSHFNRARARTLRMTVLIVLAFILCWTPTVVMSLWFLIDSDSVEKSVDPRVADVLFILTITNSVVNPYVYGSYASEMRTKCLKWFGLARSRDRLAGNGTIGLGGTASLLSQGPGPTSGGGIQPRGYFTQSERRSPRFVWSHRQTRTNRNHSSSVSENQERKAPIFLKRMPKRGKHRKLMRKWYCRTTIGRRFLSSSEHIVETPPTNGAVPKRKRRIRRSQSLTTKLPSWEKDAAKTRKAHRSCIISHLNDMPEDISVFDTSPIWSPILSRKSSARSARSRQTQRWTKLKRSRSLSELKIYL